MYFWQLLACKPVSLRLASVANSPDGARGVVNGIAPEAFVMRHANWCTLRQRRGLGE